MAWEPARFIAEMSRYTFFPMNSSHPMVSCMRKSRSMSSCTDGSGTTHTKPNEFRRHPNVQNTLKIQQPQAGSFFSTFLGKGSPKVRWVLVWSQPNPLYLFVELDGELAQRGGELTAFASELFGGRLCALQLRQPSLNEIHGWVSELNLYKEQLARENILEIMRFLAFDGLVERVERRNGRVEYHPLALGPDYNFGWERSEKTTILLR